MVRSFLCVLVLAASTLAQDKPLTRIAFGSCADQDRPLPIFEKIVALKPELYLAMGDNIYADLKREPGLDEMASMKVKYERLGALPAWQQLTKQCPILATWDDHDYGKNDLGAEYAKKDESQQLFLDFFGVPKDAPVRKQKGVYHAKTFGPVGQRVQVIMLDTRYFRSALKKGKPVPPIRTPPYLPNTDPDATMLGADQWKWLEEQLKQPAEIRLLVSSVQVVADEHPFEKWMNMPNERAKLYKLLQDTKANGVIVLSGDRHLAEISVALDAIGYPLYDITSSGLNQGFKDWRAPEKNKHRLGSMSHGDNFGFLTIDWTARSPKISLQIRDIDGECTLKETFPLSLLQVGSLTVKADLPHTPGAGAISPRDALKKVGEKVVVEMKVQAVGSSGKRLFLNSEKNFRDELNFTVVVNAAATTGKYADAKADTFKDKVIRVTGTVSEFKGTPQILVDDEKQLEILE